MKRLIAVALVIMAVSLCCISGSQAMPLKIPNIMTAADLNGNGIDDLVVNFGPTYGIWIWMDNSTWFNLHNLSPVQIIAGSFDNDPKKDLLIDFGEPYGVHIWFNNSRWERLHALNPDFMTAGDIDGNGIDDAIIDYGKYGIYLWMNNSAWSQLHTLNPEFMATGDFDGSGQDDVLVDFGRYGVYIWYNNSMWAKLHDLSPEYAVTGDFDGNGMGDVALDYGQYGVHLLMNNSTWTKLHSIDPEFLSAGDVDNTGRDELLVDFGRYGAYIWVNNIYWLPLHEMSPLSLALGNIDGSPGEEIITHYGHKYGIFSWSYVNGWRRLCDVPGKEVWAVLDDHDTQLPGVIEGAGYYNEMGGDRGQLHAEDVDYLWDGNSAYTATITHKDPLQLWTWGGMWYCLASIDADNKKLDFQNIFGPYIRPEYQGQITAIEIVINNVSSATSNTSLTFDIELKYPGESVARHIWSIGGLLSQSYPKTVTIDLAQYNVREIEQLVWLLDHAQVGDSVTIDSIKFKTVVPNLPIPEEAFLWSYSLLMGNFDPATGMVKDSTRASPFGTAGYDLENITATAKTAKNTYYAYKKGYVSFEDALFVIHKIADRMQYLPKGPVDVNTLWPHFTEGGGSAPVPPRFGYAGSEWSSGDTLYAAMDIIATLQMIGDPYGQMAYFENYLRNLNWTDLLAVGDFISHGYYYDGTKIPYNWGGFGAETIGVNWAYSSATGNAADMAAPPSDNGSGFIDNAAYPMLFSGIDGWGNDWDAYRSQMADIQTGWYSSQEHYNPFYAQAGLFGLSAAEVPDIAIAPSILYLAYGTGGKGEPEDGNDSVIVLHYAGMIADIRPVDAANLWQTLRDRAYPFMSKIILSPLNNMESMDVDKQTGALTVNHFRGAWNLSLQAEGWALADPFVRDGLENAVLGNAFFKSGYDILKEAHSHGRTLRVPQDYATIQAAIDAAQAGDTILITGGVYNENVTITKGGITLQGTSGMPLIAGEGQQATIYCNDVSEQVLLKGLRVRGYYAIKCGPAAQAVRIEGNTIEVAYTGGPQVSYGYGIYLENGASADIVSNYISYCGIAVYSEGNNPAVNILNNNVFFCRASGGSGIYLNDACALIKDNSISNSWDGALILANNSNAEVIGNNISSNYSWSIAAGIKVADSSAIFENNTINYNIVYSGITATAALNAINSSVALYNNVFKANWTPAGASAAAIYCSGSDLISRNNIIIENGGASTAIRFSGSGSQDFSYNDVWNNTTTSAMEGIALGAGNLESNPGFTNNSDCHLLPDSPCINAGDPAVEFNDTDGSRNDMGIYGGPTPSPF